MAALQRRERPAQRRPPGAGVRYCRRPERLLENLAATELILTKAELAFLEPIAGDVAGDRYPDMTETSSARETR